LPCKFVANLQRSAEGKKISANFSKLALIVNVNFWRYVGHISLKILATNVHF